MIREVDIAILGGGCAGLSLGRELAFADYQGEVIVIEPRSQYLNDRTWGFWHTRDHDLRHLVVKSWPNWSLSTPSSKVTLAGDHFLYQMIPADLFYAEAIRSINTHPQYCLMTDTEAQEIKMLNEGVFVKTTRETVFAQQVFDTRPRPAATNKALIWQIFSGAEIETDTNIFETHKASLMGNMSSTKTGMQFTYCLPLTPRRALIQNTWFMRERQPADCLDAPFYEYLDKELGCGIQILRTERGALPMGQFPQAQQDHPRIIRAGQAAGALRASSGYGFLRIQEWAQKTAQMLAAGSPASATRYDGYFDAAMDRVFLDAFKTHTKDSPEWFLSLARALTGDEFASFMSGHTSPLLWSKVIKSLPKGPFLSAALKNMARGLAPFSTTKVAKR
jgi:lycopene beta-cyclase